MVLGLDFGSAFSSVGMTAIKWLFYLILMIFIGVCAFIAFYFSGFKYKVTEIVLNGSGNKEGYTVGKIRKNKFKWNKNKTAWIPLYPLFTKVRVQPFDGKYIYTDNMVIAYNVEGVHYPGSIKTLQADGVPTITPIPHHIREWQLAQIQRNREEFIKKDFWSKYGQILVTLGTVAFCLMTVVITVYFVLTKVDLVSANLGGLTGAVNNLNVVPSVPS